MVGFKTLLIKEIMRFWKVSFQTILAPLVSTLLYLVIFAHVLSTHSDIYPGVSYGVFLIPGLMMMAMLQNAFANSSSSLIQSKVTGNLVFILLTPLSELEFYWAYVVAAMIRGMIVGTVVLLTSLFFFKLPFANPLWIILFGCISTVVASTLGIIAGIAAEKFDQMAAWQNFIIVPLTFLSGAFYSISSLSSPWNTISRLNPFLYMIDGFRYGFFSHSDVSPWLSLTIVGGVGLVLLWITLSILKSGWRLRG
ncbi:MAG: ABC transporter permease [Betaproteobacteria bacterium]|nr:ABC transporter permease [Betaproteobacteria bacterium]MDE2423358.1 ABC transporter permease [Betaproteobacteria bacterium]